MVDSTTPSHLGHNCNPNKLVTNSSIFILTEPDYCIAFYFGCSSYPKAYKSKVNDRHLTLYVNYGICFQLASFLAALLKLLHGFWIPLNIRSSIKLQNYDVDYFFSRMLNLFSACWGNVTIPVCTLLVINFDQY